LYEIVKYLKNIAINYNSSNIKIQKLQLLFLKNFEKKFQIKIIDFKRKTTKISIDWQQKINSNILNYLKYYLKKIHFIFKTYYEIIIIYCG
jgi:hypothetical protein